MKVKAPSLLKKIIEALSSKTNELRIRMTIFFLLHKNMDKSSLTQSLHALVSPNPSHRKKKNDDVLEEEEQLYVGDKEYEDEYEEECKGGHLMNYNKAATSIMGSHEYTHNSEKCEEANEDLTHALFKESEAEMEEEVGRWEEAAEGGGLVDNAAEEVVKEENDDIDQAADLFIQRFRRQIMLQKQRSLERQQRLLVSNA